MAEQLDLTTATTKTRSMWKLQSLNLNVAAKTIGITVVDNNGEQLTVTYHAQTTPTGASLLNSLNTANLTTNSLVRRVINRLVTDGYLPAGSVTGIPE